uniref:Uncharacterized protein n=1 Tax=Trichobilharzia regenti TaxID=157069 RepID=A0AA85ITQ8_TRIRE|nr:unnamed protein product [Trichobilharzia regenti]
MRPKRDSDISASKVVCIKPRYPDHNNIFDDFATTIPSTSNASNFHSSTPVGKRTTSVSYRLSSNDAVVNASMIMKKVLDTNMEIINLCTKMLNIMTTDSKSRWQTHHHSANDYYALKLPIENEEHLEKLEASLSDEKFKGIYTFKMFDCLQSDPKLSLKVMMRTVLKPEVGLTFTFQGTMTKSSILPYTFYQIMRYVILAKFSSRLMPTREVDDILDKATKSYFHNLKDHVRRRSKLRKEIQASKEETSRGRESSDSYGNTPPSSN